MQVNEQERKICTAPPGKLRIVYEDARDHWPTRQKVVKGRRAAQKFLDKVDSTARPCMVVYDDKCQLVTP